ncbi:MAG: alpha-glucosidase, partial [Oscillospiraceae bacterium]|nr:alpha-glucosidase [Oscillospiraceae bacterium]
TRDHARVPMPWQPYGGFTTGTPWLKQDRAGIQKLCVDAQERDDQSVLNFTRQLILLRRANPALLRGDFTPAAAKRRDVFCFKRSYLGETLYVEMNITNVSCAAPARPERRGLLLGSCGGSMPYLRPYEANIYKLV